MNTSDKYSFRDFEAYVASLYTSLGFKVIRNTSLAGQEVDVLADRVFPGFGQTRIAVECKRRSSGSISNQEVQNFANSVSLLRKSNLITRGVMVSNVRYSPSALATVQGYEDVELLTVAELENQLFDVRQVLGAYVDYYKSLDIFSWYIPLRATWKKPYSDYPEITENVETKIVEWVDQDEVGFVSILGDYGTGKTTLMARMKFLFSQRYITGDSRWLPLFMQLKHFYGCESLHEFVKRALVSEFERDVPLAVFWRALAEGRFLILLDGFDEMAAESDVENRSENLLLLSPLLNSKSKTILTCRPSYFVSHREYESIVAIANRSLEPMHPTFEDTSLTTYKYADTVGRARQLKYHLLSKVGGYQPIKAMATKSHRIINLELLDEEQIDQYLRKFNDRYIDRFKTDWLGIKAFLLTIYDLSDLMSRPILLNMINETVLSGRIRIGSDITDLGPSSIYELYTSMKLDLDWQKGESRQLLTREDRSAFAESIAVAMYRKGALEISYADLFALAESGPGLPTRGEDLREIQSSIVAADIQVSTFLTRSDDDIFRFAHKSFAEFFVARNLKRRLFQEEQLAFEAPIPREILYFLGGFAIPEPSVRSKLLAMYSRRKGSLEERVLSTNLAIALLYSGPWQDTLKLEDLELTGVDVKRVVFSTPIWHEIKFKDSDLYSLEMRGGELWNVMLDNTSVRRLAFKHGSYELQLLGSVAMDLTVSQSRIVLRGSQSQLLNSRIEGGEFFIAGDLAVAGVEYVDANVKIGRTSGMKFEKCTFRRSGIYFSGISDADELLGFSRNSFIECGLFGMRLPELEWEKYIERKLENCQGVVVVDSASRKVEQKGKIFVVNRGLWADGFQRARLLEIHRSVFSPEWLKHAADL